MKGLAPGMKELELLKGITGAFRPGVLTALMGASGAGKTTFLDLLAGRKTGAADILDDSLSQDCKIRRSSLTYKYAYWGLPCSNVPKTSNARFAVWNLIGRNNGCGVAVGRIEGDIRINGFPKEHRTFARVSGYVEQSDIHSPQVCSALIEL